MHHYRNSASVLLIFILSILAGCRSLDEAAALNKPLGPEQPSDAVIKADDELQQQIVDIAKEAKGKVGVYALVIETDRSVSFNGGEHFAMQSVVKLPISMAVLEQISREKQNLDKIVAISKEEYVPANMRSPLRDKQSTELTVRELIRYAISESDGTAADVLQRIAGGASGVQAYIDSLGIADTKVKYSHKEFGKAWPLQYENWTTPEAAADLLIMLWHSYSENGKEVRKVRPSNSGRDAELLLKFMTESNNPAERILAGLPSGTVVAHKTGTGGTQDGVTSATNDVAIITLPNGNHIALTVFLGDSSADQKTREGVIAKIAKAVWDKWSMEENKIPVK